MKLIVISAEKVIPQEAQILNILFEEDLPVLHLRKPLASKQETADLLNCISPLYHNRIILHDYFELAHQYNIRGIHLNQRNISIPPDIGLIHISRSCHSLKEIEEISGYQYVFLSPIFDSISKIGYMRGFSTRELEDAQNKGIINEKIIALGGISPDNIPVVANYGFGGVAVLGTLWNPFLIDRDIESLLQRFKQLKTICDTL